MSHEELFKINFERVMKNKDYASFKSDYPTLLKAIRNAMNDVEFITEYGEDKYHSFNAAGKAGGAAGAELRKRLYGS